MSAEPQKIYVQAHVSKPLVKITSTYDQAIFCILKSKDEIKTFYIRKHSVRGPMLVKGKFKIRCFEPDKLT